MYPYDIVCTAYETDLSELEQIAADADATVYQYPMVRMTSLYGSDKVPNWNGSTRPVQWPQGQHIAISESTYNQMRKTRAEASETGIEGERDACRLPAGSVGQSKCSGLGYDQVQRTSPIWAAA
ncbi:MAG: hypothetical protein ACLUUO_10750 [Sellimonas intestinalis]